MSADDAIPGLPLNVLQRLSALQDEHGWLSDATLAALSREARIPRYALEAVASYYPRYRRTPPPRVTVAVCRDAACAMRGAGALAASVRRRLATRTDVEVVEASCLGRCEVAPAAAMNGAPVGPATDHGLEAMATGKAPIPAIEPTSTGRRYATDPYGPGEPRYAVLRRLAALGTPAFEGVPAVLAAAGLQGMGGAGFPTGRKWDLVREAVGPPKYVICHAGESGPGTFKDRVLLAELPHLVIEGMLVACRVVGATTAIVYLRHAYGPEKKALARAIEDATREGALATAGVESLTIFTSPGGYVLGEETALLEALEGRRGEPRIQPPFAATHGLHGRPTLINNAETFVHVPRILTDGAEAWKARGRAGAPGLKFIALCGDVERPGVYEVPTGTTVRELIDVHGGGVAEGRRLLGFLPGGASTAFLPASKLDTPLSCEALRAAGSALGSGAVMALAQGRDVLAIATNLVRFFRDESCGKCVPCRVGSAKVVEILERVLAGKGGADDLRTLPALHETLSLSSICGLGQMALVPAISVLEHFPERTAPKARRP